MSWVRVPSLAPFIVSIMKYRFDHIALNVKDVKAAVAWYKLKLNAEVTYEDETWAMLRVGETAVALTMPNQHPSHIAFQLDSLEEFDDTIPIKTHRDGSKYQYVTDIDGNTIEYIYWSKDIDNE